ncbi:MAG: SDR family oxidoreductase [Gemmatales bacterium]
MMSATIITGGGSGIGRAAAIAIGAAGRHVVVCDRLAAAATETCRLTEEAGGSARAAVIDLADAEATDAMVADVARREGVSALIHSAGLFPQLSFAEASLDDLDAVMAVNFRAAFVLAKACAGAMPAGGSLVFLTSGAGLLEHAGDPFQRPFSLYGASKAALDRWALGIAPDLAEAGIAVATLTPGAVVDTPGTAAVRGDRFDTMARIAPDTVGRALAWLTAEPRMGVAGRRLNALEFGKGWGSE